jgi:hypothetical protein
MRSWVGVVVAAVFLSGQAAQSEPPVPLTLRVFDYAGVPAKARDEAQAQVRRIFNKAGIEPLWLYCPVAALPGPGCTQTPQLNELVIRIRAQTSTLGRGHLFGLAFVTRDGFSRYATIFYGEVQIRARNEDEFEGRVLGYAIAHEAGHLLLKNQRHPPTGVMSSGWTSGHLRSTPQQFFLFTRSEVQQLQANLKDRMAAEACSETNSLVRSSAESH